MICDKDKMLRFMVLLLYPAEPGFILSYDNTVDPDQLASEEAI